MVNGCMHSGFGMYAWLIQLVIFIGFFLVVWWLLKSSKPAQKPREKPMDVLKKRLAKGEISKKEYENLKKEIEK